LKEMNSGKLSQNTPGAQAKLLVSSANEIVDLEFMGGNGFLNSDGLRAVPVYLP